MLEISPVLTGTFDRPDYIPAAANVNRGDDIAATATSSIDPRRYSQFDRTASQVSDATMSFGDVLDLLNPLQHIPVISSVYRAITGDTINPVARVAGDILYGAALGGIGALAGGAGAVADSAMEAKTGKDVTGTVIAGLFGDDTPTNVTQLASNETASTEEAPPFQQPAAIQSVTPAALASVTTPEAPAAPPANAPEGMQLVKSFPLTNAMAGNKLPYGGVMAPLPNFHDENLKMSIAKATGVRIGNTVYPDRIKSGMRSLPPAIPVAKAAPPADTAATTGGDITASAQATQTAPIPDGLKDDALIMKALNAYRSTAENGGGKTAN